MSAPETELRAALETALRADPGVRAVLGDPLRLFEARDPRAPYPHASWGRAESRETGADGVRMIEHRLSLEIWCRDQDPMPLVGTVRAAIAAAEIGLPAPWTLVSLVPAYSDVFATRDRRLRRGLVRLRALMGRAV